jgi:uncharacterized protein YkwD
MHTVRVLAVVIVAGLALTLLSATTAAATPRYSMLAEINTARAAHGLRPLRLSPALDAASQNYAGRMIRGDFFAHASGLRPPGFQAVGEVLEFHTGLRPRVRGTLRTWLRSPGHRAIILTAGYRWIGLGRSAGRFGGRRATVWVGRLGR